MLVREHTGDTFRGQIVGISKLNNFRFTGGKLTAWRAYAVGRGKPAGVNYNSRFVGLF